MHMRISHVHIAYEDRDIFAVKLFLAIVCSAKVKQEFCLVCIKIRIRKLNT